MKAHPPPSRANCTFAYGGRHENFNCIGAHPSPPDLPPPLAGVQQQKFTFADRERAQIAN